MIRVKIAKNEDTCIEIKGHAEEDAVCAAVSGLFYALLGYLKDAGCVLEIVANPGDAKVIFKGSKKEALRMFEIGLMEIEKTYENSLRIVE